MDEKYVITENRIMKENECLDRFVRVISTKEELEELLERIPYIQTIQAPNSKLRKELYQSAMNEYDDIEWVKVIKSVYIRMEDKCYEEYEPQYMKMAKQFLYGEIAIQFGLNFEEVESFVNNAIERHLKEFE